MMGRYNKPSLAKRIEWLEGDMRALKKKCNALEDAANVAHLEQRRDVIGEPYHTITARFPVSDILTQLVEKLGFKLERREAQPEKMLLQKEQK